MTAVTESVERFLASLTTEPNIAQIKNRLERYTKPGGTIEVKSLEDALGKNLLEEYFQWQERESHRYD